MKEISEMREEKKMNECKGGGGAASIKGGAENKIIKKRKEARVGLFAIGFGPVRPISFGSGRERVYKG